MNVYHSIDIDFILTKTDHRLLQAPEQGKHQTHASDQLTASANAHPQGIDHNLYVKNGLATLSNYGAGLAVLDVSGVPQDHTGKNIKRIGWFDVHPEDDKVRTSSSPDPFFFFWRACILTDISHTGCRRRQG